jgi:hypothetical protein
MAVLVRNGTKTSPAQIWAVSPVRDDLFYFKRLAEENGYKRMRVVADSEMARWVRFNQPSRRELERWENWKLENSTALDLA